MKKFIAILVLSLLLSVKAYSSELIKIPSRVYILDIDVNGYKTITSNQDVKQDFKVLNEIWGKANIFWDLKKISKVKANVKYFKKNRSKMESMTRETFDSKFHINFWLTMFSPKTKKPISKKSINIYYIPKSFVGLAGRSLYLRKTLEQKQKYNGFVIVSHNYDVKVNYKIKRRGAVIAHELGHHMNLKHPKDWKNKSNPNIMGSAESAEFTKEQIQIVRSYSKYFLKAFK